MESTKLTALLLICIFVISSANPILDCIRCRKTPTHHPRKVIQPPVTLPPVTLPPGLVPPILPPGTTKPPTKGKPGKSSPSSVTCPVDALKLGACVDLVGGLVHVGLGNPGANKCCHLIAGLVELEAAVCMCTALKLKLLNLNKYVPTALQVLVTCGKPPPSGYTCSL